MWTEGCGVCAAVRGKGEERLRAMRRPNSYSAVPTAGAESVFGDEVPIHAEDFPGVFLPVLNRVVICCAVEQLDAAVAGCCEDLALVNL